MDAPFDRGLAWYRYKSLEDEFINATKYFPFESKYQEIWSEFFSDLLTKIGNSIDSFFRNMLKTEAIFQSYPNVKLLKQADELRKKKGYPERNRDINYFIDFFEPIYQLSNVEVDVAYGLTFYESKHCPFNEFKNKQPPFWWTSYNHVKHTWFDCIDEATLGSVVSALSGLFVLNITHKESLLYLVKHQQVITFEYPESLSQTQLVNLFKESMIGISDRYNSYNFTARTPLFTHQFRRDATSKLAKFFG